MYSKRGRTRHTRGAPLTRRSWFGGKFVWSHRYQNMLIMVGFILFFRFATFYALERINYSTR